MDEKKKTIFVTCGDPNGIGPEVTLKAVLELPEETSQRLLLAGPFQVLSEMNELLGEPLALEQVQTIKEAHQSKFIPVLELEGARTFHPSYGRVTPEAGMIAGRGIMWGTAACLQGETAALVTAPSCKEAMQMAGFHYPGQTEMIAALAGVTRFIMILTNGALRVGMATTHVAIKEVPKLLRRNLIRDKLLALQEGLQTWFRISQPRLAVAALNPHASDGGIFGNEEARIIKPAIEDAKRQGVAVVGPLPADTLFTKWKEFDGILCMYHDQGMIPIKIAAFGEAVNFTSGLPFPRTSPDHGTAFDIAGQLIANHSSMVKAIKMAEEFASFKQRKE
ncbi:MAG: 4-hydroxythreonine-4-phosphate dehydrogenase PdxA [bacterium]